MMLRVCEDSQIFAAFDNKFQDHVVIRTRRERLEAKMAKAEEKHKQKIEHEKATAEFNEKLSKNSSDISSRGVSASSEFAAAIIFSTIFGVWLDREMGTSPLFFLIFMFLGMIVAFYNLYRASENLGGGKDNSELPNDKEDATK